MAIKMGFVKRIRKFAYLSKLLYCDIRAECTSDSVVRTRHAVIFGSFVYEFEHEPNVTCLGWVDGQKAEAEVKLATPPGRRPWIKAAKDRWAERVNEDPDTILAKLLGGVTTYCVRVTLHVDGSALRPVHFIYDRLTLGSLDRDRAAVVEISVDGSDISVIVEYGPHFKSFMMARG